MEYKELFINSKECLTQINNLTNRPKSYSEKDVEMWYKEDHNTMFYRTKFKLGTDIKLYN